MTDRPSTSRGNGVTLQRQMTFWLVALAVFVLLLWLLADILLPFIAGMAIAYFLAPLVDRMERMGINRMVASLGIITLVVLAIVLVLLLIPPLLGGQLASLIQNIPTYVTKLRALISDPGIPWLNKLVGSGIGSDKGISDLLTQGAGWITTFLTGLWSGGRAIVSLFSLIVVTPVVAFYMLLDWDRMVATVDSWVPRDHVLTVRGIATDINTATAGFVRGQGTLCIVLGAMYAIGLTLTGLNFGILIGLFSGLISFIPYVGSLTGLALAVGVAFVQFWPDWIMVVAVACVFFAGQFVEGNILQPKLVGKSVGVHPVWLLLSLSAFGALFGFVGLLIAVPAAAAIAVLVRFAISRYLESPLYRGHGEAPPPPLPPRRARAARTRG